jgi:hypothetical protein
MQQIRDGRQQRSRTVSNNNDPEFDETFRMLINDPKQQVCVCVCARACVCLLARARFG